MELPTNDIKEDGDGDDCEREFSNHVKLLNQCNNHFLSIIGIDDIDDTTVPITPKEEIRRTYIEKLFKQLRNV